MMISLTHFLLSLRKTIFLGIVLLWSTVCSGQSSFVQAYRDFRGYLFVFENGAPRQLESQAVSSFKSKGPYVAYVTSGNNLKVYYNTEVFDLGDATNTSFEISNELMIYKRDEVLAVFDRGKTTRLTFFIQDYILTDKMVVFRDRNQGVLRTYVNGEIQDLEYTLIGARGTFAAGENTVAYSNSSNYFKIFHEGETFEIDNINPVSVSAGKNIVAYVDGSERTLKVFYNNKILTLEQITPLSFLAGDDLVAYVTDENSFKLFADGKLMKAESYKPDFYAVKDRSVLFFIDSKLQLLQNDMRYELDNFMPKSYKMSEDNIAWVDPANRLHFFSNGKSKQVTTELFTDYDLNGDILRFTTAEGASTIYYQGKFY